MTSLLPDLWGKDKKVPPTFETLHDEIDRVFNQFRRDFTLPNLFHKDSNGPSVALTPRIEVVDSENSLDVSVELPGVAEKDIDVSATDNVLTIKAEKKMETKDEKDNVFVSERSYGMFQRSMPLNFEIDPNKVDAKFTNGVLKITLPKPPEVQQKTKKIKVKPA